MSLPRRIVPGTTYLITRRCFERRCFLRPSKRVNRILRYCLAVAEKLTGVKVHNYTFLSNHYHLTVTDVHGNLPDFMRWLNGHIAKCLNAELGRSDRFWAGGSYSAVELVGSAASLGGMLYTYTNPVKSGLVHTMSEWPGAHSTPADIERSPQVIVRPVGFFRKNSVAPATVELRLSMPPNLDITVAELERLVAEREQKLRDEARAAGKSFLGRSRVLRQDPNAGPRTVEARRKINPRVATRDKWKRIEALQRLKSFLSAHREAWLRFAAGDRDVRFPYGTYGMVVRFGVMCNGP